MPGAELASHHHPGSQLGYVAEGVLTYTVETGKAKLMKGPGDDPKLVKTIKPGDTVKVRPGQWLARSRARSTTPATPARSRSSSTSPRCSRPASRRRSRTEPLGRIRVPPQA